MEVFFEGRHSKNFFVRVCRSHKALSIAVSCHGDHIYVLLYINEVGLFVPLLSRNSTQHDTFHHHW